MVFDIGSKYSYKVCKMYSSITKKQDSYKIIVHLEPWNMNFEWPGLRFIQKKHKAYNKYFYNANFWLT